MSLAMQRKIEPVDAFTDSVLRRIDRKVLASLSEEQVSAIQEGISSSRPLSKHPFDIRGTVPTFFAHYYFVLLMGRDRRVETQKLEGKRQRGSALAGGMLFFTFALSPLFLVALVILYLVKSDMGIDLVPGEHAWQFLGLWK